jgi:hypothetical protein
VKADASHPGHHFANCRLNTNLRTFDRTRPRSHFHQQAPAPVKAGKQHARRSLSRIAAHWARVLDEE